MAGEEGGWGWATLVSSACGNSFFCQNPAIFLPFLTENSCSCASSTASLRPRRGRRRISGRGCAVALIEALMKPKSCAAVQKRDKILPFQSLKKGQHQKEPVLAGTPLPPPPPATESHQLRHLRPHQRLPCSRSRPVHPRSQPQPQRRPIRSCSRQPPPSVYLTTRSRQRMRSTPPRTRSEGHSPNHSQLLGIFLFLSCCRRAWSLPLLIGREGDCASASGDSQVVVPLQQPPAARLQPGWI